MLGFTIGKLKKKLFKWLCSDLDNRLQDLENCIAPLTQINLDIERYQSTIIIATHLGGGRVKIIPYKFDSLQDFTNYVKHLERIYKANINVVDSYDNKCFWRIYNG